MKKSFALAILLLVLTPGLLFAQKETAAAATTDAKADVSTATFVFYRPSRFVGSALKPSVYVNGEQVARLGNGRYCVLGLKPGKYRIESSMKQDGLEIEAKAGTVQFLEMVILTGNWRGGGRLIPTSENDGRAATKKLKPLDKEWATSEQIVFQIPEAGN